MSVTQFFNESQKKKFQELYFGSVSAGRDVNIIIGPPFNLVHSELSPNTSHEIDNVFECLVELREAQYNKQKVLNNALWQNYQFCPPFPTKPKIQDFINSIRGFLYDLDVGQRAAIFLQINAPDFYRDSDRRFPESEVVLPDYTWQERVNHYAINTNCSSYLTLFGDANSLTVACDEALLKLAFWIVSLPKSKSQKISIEFNNQGVLTNIRNQANEFVRNLKKESVPQDYIQHIYEEISDVALAYNWTPITEVIAKTLPIWKELDSISDAGLSTHSGKFILHLKGQVCGLLSYAALYQNQINDSISLARSCRDLASLSGSANLFSWACGTLSMMYRFTDRPEQALEIAELGLRKPINGDLRSRLFCAAAESAAYIGKENDAIKYLQEGMDESSKINTKEELDLPGIFLFPEAKVYYYCGSTLGLIDNDMLASQAEKASEKAVKIFSQEGFDFSPTDQLVAQLHLAKSRFKMKQLDGVIDAIEPVGKAPFENRTSWHLRILEELFVSVQAPPFLGSVAQTEIAQIVESYKLSIT